MGLPQKPKIETMNDSPGPLLGINRKESKSHNNAAGSALLTIARMKSQTRWPSAEEWAKKMYIYIGEYYSVRQKDKIL